MWVYAPPYDSNDSGQFGTEKQCYDHIEGFGYPSVRQGYDGGALCIDNAPVAHPTLSELTCPATHYKGWDGDPTHAAVCIPYDVYTPPQTGGCDPAYQDCVPPGAICGTGQEGYVDSAGLYRCRDISSGGAIPDVPPPPASGACSRGNQYTMGIGSINELLGICEPGYTKGLAQTCNCDKSDKPSGQLDALGSLIQMLPQLLIVMVIVSIIGAFRR